MRRWIEEKDSNFSPDPEVILWNLANDGHIPFGDYLLDIWW